MNERPLVLMHRTLKEKNETGGIVQLNGVNFRNIGRTPAFISKFTVVSDLHARPPKPFTLALKPYPPSSVVIPNEEWPLKNSVPHGISAEQLQKGTERGSADRLYVYGVMVYADYAGVQYCTWFCRVYANGSFAFDPDRLPELATLEYNGSGRVTDKQTAYKLTDGRFVEPDIFWTVGRP